MRRSRRTIQILATLVFCAGLAISQQPPSASEMLESAKAQAASSSRNIFVIFHASW